MLEFQEIYPSEQECMDRVFTSVYGDLSKEIECPKCGASTHFKRVQGRKAYRGIKCNHQIYPLSQTIMKGSKLDVRVWFQIAYEISKSLNMVSAMEVLRSYVGGSSYKTAYYAMEKFGQIMCESGRFKLTGEIAVDESQIVADKEVYKGKKRQHPDVWILTLCETRKGGKALAFHLKSRTAKHILPIIEEHVEKGSVVYTDKLHAYNELGSAGYTHKPLNKSAKGVKGWRNTNKAEGFFGRLDRSVLGTYTSIIKSRISTSEQGKTKVSKRTAELVQNYLNRLCFVYNHGTNVNQSFNDLIDRLVSSSET